MKNLNFSTSPHGACKVTEAKPDEISVTRVLKSSKKKPKASNTIIIARYEWLKRNKLSLPSNIELPNLCVTIKEGKLIRAFYSNVLSHIIKKQKYYIQILN